jgi:hypothetical protein
MNFFNIDQSLDTTNTAQKKKIRNDRNHLSKRANYIDTCICNY